AGNLPLASSDLSSIVSSFGGTAAGQEAQLLLGEVRLRQGQAALAVTELQRFVDGGPSLEYRAQAYDLLGVALEQTGQLMAAGSAFERGADAAGQAQYGLMSANMLLNAGRSYAAAGDTTAAIRALERVLADHEETTAASEAKLRLAELGRYES
ncbi:MAG: tetratricopeptide repeat protein, partial [Synechococcaceae cyanobacterium]|nr:tetratricopeptide repeat protein [Synechococcaceae cyanobacterium]